MIKNLLYRMVGIKPLTENEIKDRLSQEKRGNAASNVDEFGDDPLIAFTFYLGESGQLYIKYTAGATNEEIAELTAQFLFLLNNGSLKQNIAAYFNILKQQSKNVKYNKFLDSILEKWAESMMEEEDYENEPIVRPSMAFSLNQHRAGGQPQSDELDDED